MGSNASLNCCLDHVQEPHELQPLHPSKIKVVQPHQEDLTPIKHSICRTSFLAELDYYLTKIKNNPKYSKTFVENVGNIEDVLDMINYQQNQNWDVPIQAKTYNLQDNRFDSTNNHVYPSEFGILILNANYEYSSTSAKCNLKKLQFLLLQKPLNSYPQAEYSKLLFSSLNQWQGLNDYTWVLQQTKSYSDVTRQLLYHLNRYISFINSQLSLNDIVSLIRVRYLYHYFLNQIALENHELLQKYYCYQNWIHQAEVNLLRIGQIITFHTFNQLKPYTEEQVNEDDAVRVNPPKGDEQIPKVKLRVIVKPLPTTNSAVKFRCFQYLYYLPFSMFVIDRLQQRHGLKYLYLKELQSQKIIDFLSNNTKERIKTNKNPTKNQKNILNQLSQFRNQYAKSLQQQNDNEMNEVNQQTRVYYERYIKNRVNVIISQQELPVLSKRQLQICDDQVKLKIQQQTPHDYVDDSEIQQALPSSQQIKTFQKQLDRYIKDNNFQKIQNQIDSVDIFINLTSLNISQSWLEKLQCIYCFPNLVQLFAYSNLIKKIQGLENNHNLRVLSLARNDIAVLQNLNHLTHLRELYLTKNKLELPSASYLSTLSLSKLKILAISFKNQPEECFEVLMRRPPPSLKKIVINQGDFLTNRTKNTLKRRLKGVEIHFVHG